MWGQFLPVPMVAKGGLSVIDGRNQQQMTLAPQGQSAVHHELRMTEQITDYMMYCIFCGELGTQVEWVELLRGLVKEQR